MSATRTSGPGRFFGTGRIANVARTIDTTPVGGKLISHVLVTSAEFERDLIHERTHAGLRAARARGRVGGRPKKLADPKQLALAIQLYDSGTEVAVICSTLGISRATLYREISRSRAVIQG